MWTAPPCRPARLCPTYPVSLGPLQPRLHRRASRTSVTVRPPQPQPQPLQRRHCAIAIATAPLPSPTHSRSYSGSAVRSAMCHRHRPPPLPIPAPAPSAGDGQGRAARVGTGRPAEPALQQATRRAHASGRIALLVPCRQPRLRRAARSIPPQPSQKSARHAARGKSSYGIERLYSLPSRAILYISATYGFSPGVSAPSSTRRAYTLTT